MLKALRFAVALVLACAPGLAIGQTASSVMYPAGWAPGMSPCVKQVDGTCLPVSAANPMPVTGGGGGGSTPTGTAGTPNASVVSVQGIGGGTAIAVSNASLPLPTGAATSAAQASLLTALGTPLQAGGLVNVGSPANVSTAQVTVVTTATLVAASRSGRQTVTIENTGTTAFYVGGAGVTAATGFLVPGVLGASLTLSVTGAIYAITASGSAAVSEYETY
jgi:hypothetical protein